MSILYSKPISNARIQSAIFIFRNRNRSGGDFCRRYANSLGEGTLFEAPKELYGFAIKVSPAEKSGRLSPATPTEKKQDERGCVRPASGD